MNYLDLVKIYVLKKWMNNLEKEHKETFNKIKKN